MSGNDFGIPGDFNDAMELSSRVLYDGSSIINQVIVLGGEYGKACPCG